MARLRAALLAASAGALVIPTQPVLTRYAAGKVLEAAELKAKDEEWPVTICVCDGGGVDVCGDGGLGTMKAAVVMSWVMLALLVLVGVSIFGYVVPCECAHEL